MYDTLDAFASIKPPTASQNQVYSVSMDHSHRRNATRNMRPYVFLMLIDDLQTMLDTFKFVDDVTLCEVVADPSTCNVM